MSGRIFQNVVLQLKENTDRTVGVIDGEGVVIACSELSMIGQRWSEYVAAVNGAAGSMVCFDGKTFKALSGWGNQFDYAVFAFGDNEISKTICSMATVALNAAKSYYEEKHDRGSFVKDIISDNIMLGDIYMRAKELRVATDVSRGIFAIRALQKGESVPTETIQAMFPDRQNDFVLSVGEGDVVLIRQLPDGAGSKELNKTAAQIEEALRVNGESTVVVGMGTCGISAGARPVMMEFVEEIKRRGVQDAMVTQTGCIGVCRLEPMVEVYMPGQEKVTYVLMTPEKVARVVGEHLINGKPVTEYTIGAVE